IFGCLTSSPQDWVRSALPGMAARMRRPTQGEAEIGYGPDDRGGLGALVSKEFGALAKVDGSEGPWLVALDGRTTSPSGPGDQWARDLVARLETAGAQSFRGLHGTFTLAFLDLTRGRLIVVTDHMATRSIYWTRLPGGLAFTSELKGFLALPDVKVRIDPQAVASFLRYGRIFGRRTIWRDVWRLPPGTLLEYDAAKDTVTEQTYWRAEEWIEPRQALTPERKAALTEAFRQGVLHGYPESGRVGLSLSGGLDSRGILSAI